MLVACSGIEAMATNQVDTYTISVNYRYTNQHRTGSRHILKYKFTLTEPGVVTPVVYVDNEEINSYIGWGNNIYNLEMTKTFSSGSSSVEYKNYEDSNGHSWIIYNWERCRLPAGTYYMYFGAPGAGVNEYGYFDLKINFESEESKTNVEKEFNDTRNTANNITFDKTFYGNNTENDVDYFRFNIPEKKKISLNFYTRSGSYGMNFSPCIVNSSGNTVGNYECKGEVRDSNEKVYTKYVYSATLNAGTYYFRVSNFYNSFVDYKFNVKIKPSTVKGVSLIRNGSNRVGISYSKVSLATKYEIYRKTGSGSWKKVATTTSNFWTNSGIKKGKTYYYKVRALNGKTNGSFSAVKKIRL